MGVSRQRDTLVDDTIEAGGAALTLNPKSIHGPLEFVPEAVTVKNHRRAPARCGRYLVRIDFNVSAAALFKKRHIPRGQGVQPRDVPFAQLSEG